MEGLRVQQTPCLSVIPGPWPGWAYFFFPGCQVRALHAKALLTCLLSGAYDFNRSPLILPSQPAGSRGLEVATDGCLVKTGAPGWQPGE